MNVWYFAYGSNLDHQRFLERVGTWTAHRQAALLDYELRFSGEVTSEGGGGAIVQPAPGKCVLGGLYEITAEQITAMDAVELGSAMNHDQRGVRRTVAVESEGETLPAELYEVPVPKLYRAPSARYLDILIKGLGDFGYGDDATAAVTAVASREPLGPAPD